MPLWAKSGLRSTLRASNLQNFPGGAYPQTPLASACLYARIQTVRPPKSLPSAVVYCRASGKMSDAEVAVHPNCLRARHSLLLMEALLNAPAIFFFVGEGEAEGGPTYCHTPLSMILRTTVCHRMASPTLHKYRKVFHTKVVLSSLLNPLYAKDA